MARHIVGATLANRSAVADYNDIYHDLSTGKTYQYWNNGWREVPREGTDHSVYVKKTDAATASALGLVKQGVAVADAASTAPTAAEFKALLDSLRDAGIIATAAAARSAKK